MDDEFKLCWKNFQDNIASGFQNLYDRGDLVDVTLACDGKLLHAHKIVLAICSPYFQEIFITNPCKHPIIILKDVHFNIMCELLEFMYQGVVNVKHTELQSFMKIGQLLQIKGLATNSSAAATTIPEKLTSKKGNPAELESNISTDSINRSNFTNETNSYDVGSNSVDNSSTPAKVPVLSPASSPLPMTSQPSKCSPDNIALQSFQLNSNLKRNSETNNDALSMYQKKPFRRAASHSDQVSDQNDDENDTGIEHVNPEDFFLSAIPHISMVEPRYDLSSVKREGDHSENPSASSSMRNSFGPSFGFDYNLYKNSSCPNMGAEFSNDMHVPNDYSKNFGNHMDIPPGSSNVTMLSSTSLLHGNCVFNRNNTVATQQGMKTYWLCKSYRISMCRARCITHQGRVISATGVHNHPPHMRKGPTASGSGNYNDGSQIVSTLPTPASNITAVQPAVANMQSTTGGCFPNLRSSQAPLNMFQPNQSSQHPLSISPNLTSTTHLHPHPNLMIQPYSAVSQNINVINSQAMAITNSQSAVSVSSQSQDNVTSNIMLSSNILPNSALMHPPPSNSPYLRDSAAHNQSLNSSLVITPVATESPKHIHSPSNLNKHPQFRGSLIELPSNSAMPKLPLKGNFGSQEESCSSEQMREQILLANNAKISPSDMRLSSKNFGDNRNVPATSSEGESQGEAQVSRPIRISPDSGHNFKIENI